MALPDDATVCTVSFGPYTDAEGLAALVSSGGKLTTVAADTGKPINVTHVATGQVILPKAVDITIGSDGTGSVGPIPHTDNPGLSPVGFAYRVEWNIASNRPSPRNKTFALPQAKGATADFDLLDEAEAVPGVLVPIGEGPQGDPGLTAYEVAVAEGFVGTEAAWLASLKGAQGEQGDPSVTPEAVAANLPARLSEEELRAAFGSRTRAYGDPAGQPNGAITTLTSGQTVQSFGSAPLVVSGGRYTHVPFAGPNSAGYLQVDLGERVGRITAAPIWAPGATGAIALVLPSDRWDQGSFPPAGVHFVMYADSWHIGYWTGSAETPEYAHGEFATALDDGHPHVVDLVLDGDTAYLNFPDGSTYPVQHANIESAVTTRAIWELYEGDGTTDAPAQFAAVWADTVPTSGKAAATPLDVAATRARIPAAARPVVDTSASTATVTNAEVEVMRSTLTVPQNHRQWVACSAYIEVTTAAQVYFQVRITTEGGSGGQLQWEQLVVDGTTKGTHTVSRPIDLSSSGFSVGDRVDVVWNVWATAASAGQIVADANRAKTMHLTPVA